MSIQSLKNGRASEDTSVNVETTRKDLRRFLDPDDAPSMAAVARHIDYGASTLSQWLSGSYGGDNAAIAQRVRSYLDTAQTRKRTRRRVQFDADAVIETAVLRRIVQAATMARMESEIAVIVGDAGVGKTVAAAHYTRKHPTTVFVEVEPSFTPRTIAADIHRTLGMGTRGTTYSLMRGIVEKLERTDRLLVVDEAEYLPPRALELLRRIHDKAGVGVLLLGLPRLLYNLKGSSGEFRQLWSRVSIRSRVQPLERDEAERVIRHDLPDADNDLVKAFLSLVSEKQPDGQRRVNCRSLRFLVKRALGVARLNDMTVSAAVVKRAGEMLMLD